MDKITHHKYLKCLHIGLNFFNGVDRSLSKRHEINNFLAFGFRKDDVVLNALKDRWTDAESVPLQQLNYWVDNKLSLYLNHWSGISERVENNQILHFICSGVENVIRESHQDSPKDPSGNEYTSIHEIKVAIALIIAIFIVNQKGVSISAEEARNELNLWKDRVVSHIKKLFSDLNIPSEQQYVPLKMLVDEVNQLIQTNS